MDTQSENKTELSGTGKAGFSLLLIFAILAVVLGFMQMRNNIFGPFAKARNSLSKTVSITSSGEDLSTKDTDKDGIADILELEFHQTSPYLADSDSDGVSDKEEIDRGSDPLCPEGRSCGTDSDTPVEKVRPESPLRAGADAFELSDFVNPTSETGSTESGGALTQPEFPVDIEALVSDTAKLRELLLSSGQATKEQLDQIDDSALVEAAKKALGAQ